VQPSDDLVAPVLAWFEVHRRELPWRAADRTPWGVLVSEVMLQQTPVARVDPAWTSWMRRWPDPAALAGEAPGEAVRQWGRLGYPRRALNLHAAAGAIVERHGGRVPESAEELRALPGVGEYTAAAVLAFAFGRRSVVLDTNVRRVIARAVGATEQPAPHLTADERARAAALVPARDAEAAQWSAAVMELGALVCTAASPGCGRCPLEQRCAWVRAGRPAYDGPTRRPQPFAGTDRQARGALLAVLREHADPVARSELERAWSVDVLQRERALDGLVADGLVEPLEGDRFRLPAGQPESSRQAPRGSRA
jgi:A/G-specific adenine glycosylase